MKHRVLIPLALAAGVFYGVPAAFKRAFAPPQRKVAQTPGDLDLPEEQIWLRSASGTRLHAWYISVGRPAPAVVVLHGWGGNAGMMLPLAPHLHSAGFHGLFIDARNHGYSEHDDFVSMPRFAEDLEAGVAWLQERPEVTSIGAIGHSVGAGAAILSGSRSDDLDAVVAVSSFAHPGEMMRAQLTKIPRSVLGLTLRAVESTIGYRFESFAPRNRIGEVRCPVMLVHGDTDQVVPIADAFDLASHRPDAEILVVPGGGHSDLAPFEPYVGDIVDFLRRNLESSPDGRITSPME